MPALTLSIGEIIPGQFGPINLDPDRFTYSQTFIESDTGIPSVIQIIDGIGLLFSFLL